MVPKREISPDDTTTTSSSSSPSKKSKSPKSKSIAREKWSSHEEALFLEAIDQILRSSLWAQVKGQEELSKRGANGIRAHWDAMYRKLKKQ